MDSKLSARQGKTKVEENEESIITLQRLMSCLELPWFSGNPPRWPQFILLFKCLGHDQPLINIQTRTNLQRALAGGAKKTIGGMLNHDHLFKAALAELEEQFRNEVFVAGALVETVLDHTIVVEGYAGKLFVHKAIATMKSLGYSCDLASLTNSCTVLQKVPDSLRER